MNKTNFKLNKSIFISIAMLIVISTLAILMQGCGKKQDEPKKIDETETKEEVKEESIDEDTQKVLDDIYDKLFVTNDKGQLEDLQVIWGLSDAAFYVYDRPVKEFIKNDKIEEDLMSSTPQAVITSFTHDSAHLSGIDEFFIGLMYLSTSQVEEMKKQNFDPTQDWYHKDTKTKNLIHLRAGNDMGIPYMKVQKHLNEAVANAVMKAKGIDENQYLELYHATSQINAYLESTRPEVEIDSSGNSHIKFLRFASDSVVDFFNSKYDDINSNKRLENKDNDFVVHNDNKDKKMIIEVDANVAEKGDEVRRTVNKRYCLIYDNICYFVDDLALNDYLTR